MLWKLGKAPVVVNHKACETIKYNYYVHVQDYVANVLIQLYIQTPVNSTTLK